MREGDASVERISGIQAIRAGRWLGPRLQTSYNSPQICARSSVFERWRGSKCLPSDYSKKSKRTLF